MAKTIVRVTTRGFAREETIEKVGRRGALVTLQAGTDDLRSVTVDVDEHGAVRVYLTRMRDGSAEQVGQLVMPAPRPCGDERAGARCTLPAGHSGPHCEQHPVASGGPVWHTIDELGPIPPIEAIDAANGRRCRTCGGSCAGCRVCDGTGIEPPPAPATRILRTPEAHARAVAEGRA